MKLKNGFTKETRELFYEVRYLCWVCGGNGSECGGIEAHHITGRDSSSPFNLAPVCKSCHAKMGHTQDEECFLFKKTMDYLLGRTQVTPLDEAFMLSHPYLLTSVSDTI